MRWSQIGAALTLTACMRTPASDPPNDTVDASGDVSVDRGPALDQGGSFDADRPPPDRGAPTLIDARPEDVDWDGADGHAQVDAEPIDAALAPDAAPEPAVCGDVVGQWTRLDRCVHWAEQRPPLQPPQPTYCGPLNHDPERRYRSSLVVDDDGTFTLTCQARAQFADHIHTDCEDAQPTCQAAIDALDPLPFSAVCDRPDAAECHCYVSTVATHTVEGTWIVADGALRLTRGDEVHALPCRDRPNAPVAEYVPPQCAQARPIPLPLPSPSEYGDAAVRVVPEGVRLVVVWARDGVLHRAELDRNGNRWVHPIVLEGDFDGSFAAFGDEVIWINAEDGGCALKRSIGNRQTRVADDIACLEISSAVRGPDGIDAVGTIGRFGHVQMRGDRVELHTAPVARGTAEGPMLSYADDGLGVLFDGEITGLPRPERPGAGRNVGQVLRWNAPTRTLFGVDIVDEARRGNVRVHLAPTDGPAIDRVLFEDVTPFVRGADIHAEGDGIDSSGPTSAPSGARPCATRSPRSTRFA